MTITSSRSIGAIVLLLAPGLVVAQAPGEGRVKGDPRELAPAAVAPIANAGFEEGTEGTRPTGWAALKVPGYQVVTSQDRPAEGLQCATLVGTDDSERGPFGNLMQSIETRALRGKRVRFRAAVRAKVSGKGNQAQMWFRVDRRSPDGAQRIGAFDNMSDRPITGDQWQYYEIVADVADDAQRIALGVMLAGIGQAWVDDVSLEVVGEEVAVTTGRSNGDRRSGTPLSEIRPGLFEIVCSSRMMPDRSMWGSVRGIVSRVVGQPTSSQQTVLIPLPLSYRDQVPLDLRLVVDPAGAVREVDIYEDVPGNFVLKLVIDDVDKWKQIDIRLTATMLVGPSSLADVPATAPLPESWPDEVVPWLAATWCADARHERIQALATEIRAETGDVLQMIRCVEREARRIFRSAAGRGQSLTAVEALDKQGSCTSCANLVAALLRASGVPARILAGYPAWSGPLQTHYLVEAYVPEYGWYPIESTLCRSPWPNTHQVNVAIIPPEYEEQSKAGARYWAAAGVPYLSLTEMPDNKRSVWMVGTIDGAPSCDHECRMVRPLEGTPDEWQQALERARPRWQAWLATDHEIDGDGQLRFDSGEITATSVGAIANEPER